MAKGKTSSLVIATILFLCILLVSDWTLTELKTNGNIFFVIFGALIVIMFTIGFEEMLIQCKK